MNNKLRTVLALAVFCIGLIQVNAQKVGYINSQAVIASLPEVKEANSNITTFGQQLENRAKQMYATLEKKYADLKQKQDSGEVSPKQLQTEAALLQQEEVKLQQFQSSSQQEIAKKQDELLSPILERVQGIIDEIASAEGYTFIFDASQGVILYADESTDITDKVKAKLGITE